MIHLCVNFKALRFKCASRTKQNCKAVGKNVDKDLRFPLADVLWTLAMALDTYLVVFHHFDAHSLHKLELKYIGGITVVTFIPALIFLFIRSPEKGPIYGSETIWCSVSPHWMLIRLILYYIPVWYVLLSLAVSPQPF